MDKGYNIEEDNINSVTKIPVSFQSFYDSNPNPVAIFNSDERMIYSNPAFVARYGNENKTDLESIFDSNAHEWSAAIRKCFAVDKSNVSFVSAKCTCDFVLYKVVFDGEEICIASGHDMSQWIEKARINEEVEKDLKDKNTTKDRIFSIIAHDLKNPIGTLEQVSKIIKYDFDSFSKEDLRDYIGDIYRTSKSASSLLETLLNWAHVQKGTAQFDPSETSLRLIADKCRELLSIKARQKDINIHNNISDSLFAYADPKMIYTVMRNLVTNSLKFTPSGGRVDINAEKGNDFVKVEIKDSGVGMSEKKAKELFSVDNVESTEGTDNESGTGLGLVLCKDFIEMHGGSIWAESSEGKGTSVYFTLSLNK